METSQQLIGYTGKIFSWFSSDHQGMYWD